MLAFLSGKSGLTNAGVVVHFVDALAAVGAGVLLAVVNVDVTHLTRPAGLTDAPIKRKNIFLPKCADVIFSNLKASDW